MFTALRCMTCRQIFRLEEGSSQISQDRSSRRQCRTCSSLLGEHHCPTEVAPKGISAALEYRGEVRDLIIGLKFQRRRNAVRQLAVKLVEKVRSDHQVNDFDIVTWAPTSDRRVRQRGYDQSELLARAVARKLRLPCRRLLFRDRSATQTGRTRADRLQGPTFRARPMRRQLRVLVIDDVVTTGGTLRAAAHALNISGSSTVTLLAVAATPSTGLVTSWQDV